MIGPSNDELLQCFCVALVATAKTVVPDGARVFIEIQPGEKYYFPRRSLIIALVPIFEYLVAYQ